MENMKDLQGVVENGGCSVVGEVEYVLRDAKTLEVVERKVKRNKIQPTLFISLLETTTADNLRRSIVVGTQSLQMGLQSRALLQGVAESGFIAVTDNITGIEYGTYVELNEVPALQVAGRLPAPSQAKVWKCVCLGHPSSNAVSIHCGTNLETPCQQETTQVLDIYYRLLFKSSEENGLATWKIKRMVKGLAQLQREAYHTGRTHSYSNSDMFTLPVMSAFPLLRTYPKSDGVRFGGFAPAAAFFALTPENRTPENMEYLARKTQWYGHYSSARSGTEHFPSIQHNRHRTTVEINRTLMAKAYNKGCSLYQEGEFRPVRTVGNTFSHKTRQSPNVTGALQDIDNMATGSGVAKYSGNWAPAKPADDDGVWIEGTWPKQVRAVIKTSGKASDSSATYYIEERTLVAGDTGTLDIPTLDTVSDSTLFKLINKLELPEDYLKVDLPFMATYVALQDSEWNNASGSIATKGTLLHANHRLRRFANSTTTLLLNDYKKVYVYNIVTGQNLVFSHESWTNIRSVECEKDGTIYVGDGTSGLWRFNGKKHSNPITQITDSSGTADLSKVYSISFGKDGDIWVLCNGGLAKFGKTSQTWAAYKSDKLAQVGSSFGGRASEWSDLVQVCPSAIDDDKVLIVSNNKTVYKVVPSTGSVTELGRNFGANFVRNLPGTNNFLIIGGINLYEVLTDWNNSTTETYDFVAVIHDMPGGSAALVKTPTDRHCYLAYLTDLKTPIEGFDKKASLMGSSKASHAWSSMANHSRHYLYYLGAGVFLTDTGSSYNTKILRCVETPLLCGNTPESKLTPQYTTYGWNGSQWVKGSTQGRPCHTEDAQLTMFEGDVRLKFTDGDSGISFKVGEDYATTLYDGLHVDNATEMQVSTMSYLCFNQLLNKTLSIPSAVSNTGPIDWVNHPANYEQELHNVGGHVKCKGDVGSVLFLERNKPLIGQDWQIDVDYTGCSEDDVGRKNSRNPRRGSYVTIGFTRAVREGNAAMVSRSDDADTQSMSYNGNTVKWGTTTDDLFKFFNFEKTDLSAVIPTLQLKGSPMIEHLPKMTIARNGSACLVPIGESGAKTGTYRNTFLMVDPESPDNYVKIDGQPVPIRWDNTAPALGEVAIPAGSGVIICNEQDTGKQIEYNLRVCYVE